MDNRNYYNHIKVQKVTAYKLKLFYAENLTWEKDWHYNLNMSKKANWKYQNRLTESTKKANWKHQKG